MMSCGELSRTLVVSLLLVILVLSSGANALYTCAFSDPSESWWNYNWKHRRPVIIANASNETLSEFQVRINVCHETDMRPDFSDVRFVRGASENLSYWKQSYVSGLNAVFWVKVPELPSDLNVMIYMYFGNFQATDESSGDSVFEFFDDFGSGLKKWNLYGVPLPDTFQDLRFHDGWGYETSVQTTFRSGSWSKTFLNMTEGVKVEFRVMQDEGEIHDMFNDIGVGALQSGYTRFSTDVSYCSIGLYGYFPNGDQSLNNATIYTATPEVLIENASNDLKFHNYLIDYRGPDNAVNFLRDDMLVTTLKAQARPFSELPVFIDGVNFHNTNYLDYIFARKRAEPEPASLFGDEETLQIFELVVDGTTQKVQIISDSMLEDISFNQTQNELRLSVFSTGDSPGFCDVTIPKTLLSTEPPDSWEVRVDGLSSVSISTHNETYSSVYIEYAQGNHNVTIRSSGFIAEFPFIVYVEFFAGASSALALVTARSKIRKLKSQAQNSARTDHASLLASADEFRKSHQYGKSMGTISPAYDSYGFRLQRTSFHCATYAFTHK
jgi:hypothetical protein